MMSECKRASLKLEKHSSGTAGTGLFALVSGVGLLVFLVGCSAQSGQKTNSSVAPKDLNPETMKSMVESLPDARIQRLLAAPIMSVRLSEKTDISALMTCGIKQGWFREGHQDTTSPIFEWSMWPLVPAKDGRLQMHVRRVLSLRLADTPQLISGSQPGYKVQGPPGPVSEVSGYYSASATLIARSPDKNVLHSCGLEPIEWAETISKLEMKFHKSGTTGTWFPAELNANSSGPITKTELPAAQ